MDRSNEGGSYGSEDVTFAPRISFDRTSPLLHNKSSSPSTRAVSQPANYSYIPSRLSRPDHPSGLGDNNRVRKNSLRHVVRKIFGRRSRDVGQEQQQEQDHYVDQGQHPSLSGHGYHRSDTTGLATTQEVPETDENDHVDVPSPDEITQRTLSIPMVSDASQRARSPYAVAFPSHSLKPLSLPNPFAAPGSQLRRRKTTSSIRQDLTSTSESVLPGMEESQPGTLRDLQDSSSTEIGLAIGSTGSAKRRSRSADDLKKFSTILRSPPRKRSDEIKYWRESFQGSITIPVDIVRSKQVHGPATQGLRLTSLPDEEVERRTGYLEPINVEPLTAGEERTTHHRHDASFSSLPDVASPSVFGTEATKDLEDRVARLESGLLNFSRSLQRLTAERNRRTIVVSDSPMSRRRSWDRTRTPSMLADTLGQRPAVNTLYGSEELENQTRPATSPEPITPTREERRPPLPRPAASALSSASSRQLQEAFTTPSQQQQQYQQQEQRQPPDYTFRSLYQMLTDERSARRRLETQVRSLRSEINTLQYQVSSGVISERSSYAAIPRSDPTVRLRQMLRETEEGSSYLRQQRVSGETSGSAFAEPRVVSRFSGTDTNPESAVAGDFADIGDEFQSRNYDEEGSINTPYDAYRTPVEEYSQGFSTQYPPPPPPLALTGMQVAAFATDTSPSTSAGRYGMR